VLFIANTIVFVQVEHCVTIQSILQMKYTYTNNDTVGSSHVAIDGATDTTRDAHLIDNNCCTATGFCRTGTFSVPQEQRIMSEAQAQKSCAVTTADTTNTATLPQKAIVVLGGAFCPPHAGHVNALREAATRVEEMGFVVTGGYLAPAPAGYVRHKFAAKDAFDRNLAEALTTPTTTTTTGKVSGKIDARVDMCNALRFGDVLAIDRTYGSAQACGQAMAAEGTHIFCVQGPDRGKSKTPSLGLDFVHLNSRVSGGLSSTAVRAELRGGTSVQHLVDDGAVPRQTQRLLDQALSHLSAAADESSTTSASAAAAQTFFPATEPYSSALAATDAFCGNALLAQTRSFTAAEMRALGHDVAAADDDDVECILVYQAYSPAIGEYAIAHQRFSGCAHFSLSRMTWIKPSFLWMMFRSGWATKPGQGVVIGLWLRKTAFLEMLTHAIRSSPPRASAQTSSGTNADHASRVAAYDESVRVAHERAAAPATAAFGFTRVQWDPDHLPRGGKHAQRKAIQIGLKQVESFGATNTAIVAVVDMREFVAAQHAQLKKKGGVFVHDELLKGVGADANVNDDKSGTYAAATDVLMVPVERQLALTAAQHAAIAHVL
jgi:hypothetical protein